MTMLYDLQFVHPEHVRTALIAACLVAALEIFLLVRRVRVLAWRSRAMPGRIFSPLRMFAASLCTTSIGLGLGLLLLKPYTLQHRDRQLYEPLDIVIAEDVSLSMLAPATADPCGPSRLQVARDELDRFLDSLKEANSDRVGFIAYSKLGYRLVPILTRDYDLVSRVISDLTEKEVASGSLQFGTNHWDAIAQAGKVLNPKSRNKKVLILISDGELDAPENVLQKSRVDAVKVLGTFPGLKVILIGIGHSLDAYPIVKRRGAGGCPEEFFVQEDGDDKGQIITTHVDVPHMTATAAEFNGSYRHSQTGSDLAKLVNVERISTQYDLSKEFAIGILALLALLIILKTP